VAAPGIDLATIFRAHRHELTLRPVDARVVDRIVDCRTAALGGHMYISRYVHRVAIADRRIVAYDGRLVTFEYRDRANADAICAVCDLGGRP
jgi:hypothetical protein